MHSGMAKTFVCGQVHFFSALLSLFSFFFVFWVNNTSVVVHSSMAKFVCVVKFIKLVLYLSNVAFHAWIGSIFVVLFIIKPR
jgi:hypothetical protein